MMKLKTKFKVGLKVNLRLHQTSFWGPFTTLNYYVALHVAVFNKLDQALQIIN